MFQRNKKKLIVLSAGVAVLALSSFAFQQQTFPKLPPPQNLKILDSSIEEEDLIAVMHEFNKALNYSCGDCHAASKEDPKRLDFASEANRKKEVARKMMKMTMELNEQYFRTKGSFQENYLANQYKVTCFTCHHGAEHPETLAPPEEDED